MGSTLGWLKTYPAWTSRATRLSNLQQTPQWSWRKLGQFSMFTHLLKDMSLLFRFTSRLQRQEEDCDRKTALYIMKTLQQQEFAEKLGFLLDPFGRLLSHLVHVLDLFMGRINRSLYFGHDVKNTFLLGGGGQLITKLIVMNCYSRCYHLGVGSTLVELRCSHYWVLQEKRF